VERGYSGPARVAGSAGTGKTIVALHRAVYLARKHSDSRVLLTTFSESLSNALKSKLNRLVSNEPRLAERIDVQSLESLGLRLYRLKFGPVNLLGRDQVRALIKKSAAVSKQKFNAHFLVAEWEQVVDAWQLETWESYRDVPRLGRKTRLPGVQREQLWLIYHEVMEELKRQKAVTLSGMFTKLAKSLSESPNKPYEFAVVDEAQDIGIAQLKFFAAFGADRPDTLFFAGDQGQRIFQQPFSWKSLGVDIRGRSRMLKVNYRTSHQIRMKADLLLDPELTDVDGNIEDRSLTVSVFNGPAPLIKTFDDADEEVASNALWLKTLGKDGLLPHEIGVFVRSESELDRAKAAVKQAGLAFSVLDDHVNTISGKVSICTMHLAKGLEFRAVLVMACDDEVIPQQERIETVGDDADLKEVHDTERQLLYVACTRARDHLLVTGVEPSSEFLEDMCV
jgi:superfamily I DNA/RNA helicase